MTSRIQSPERAWLTVMVPTAICLSLLLIKSVELLAINYFRHGSEKSDIVPALFLGVAVAMYSIGLLGWSAFAKLLRPELSWWHRVHLYILTSLVMTPFSLVRAWLLADGQQLPFVVTSVIPKLIHLAIFMIVIMKARTGLVAAAH